MRILPFACSLLAPLLFAATAAATPFVSVHWGSCPFPAHESINRNQGTGPKDTITVTVKGLSGPVQAAQVILQFSSPGGLADAWRYDDAGCEAGRVTLENTSPGDPCPPLLGANLRRIVQFDYDDLSKKGRIVYAQAFDVINADPNVSYTIGRFVFDHSAPDPCGCLETPVCIFLANAVYLDGASNEIPFVISGQFLTWNDPANSNSCPFGGDFLTTGTCGATPVRAGSWGSVKATYR